MYNTLEDAIAYSPAKLRLVPPHGRNTMLDSDFVNTPEEKAELEQLTLIGVDITRPLEEQSQDAQSAYWLWVRDFAIRKLFEIRG